MSSRTEQSLEVAAVESWFDSLAARLQARIGETTRRGLLSVADQMVVSGTHFLTSVVVGRVCGPEELGDYTLGFTIYCLFLCVQTTLISQPFTVRGNYLQGDEQLVLSGSTFVHCAAFGLLVMAVLSLASGALGLGYGPPGLAPLVGMLSVAFPLACLTEFARRFALARLEMRTVFAIDVTMSAIRIGGLLVLASLGWLSALGAYAVLGVGAAIVGFTSLARRRRQFVVRLPRIVADAKHSWQFGRWPLVSQLTLAARASAVLWLLALLLDTTSAGVYVASESLMRLSAPLMMAVASVLVPSAARAFAKGNTSEVRRLVHQSAAVLGIATSLLCGLFLLFGGIVLSKLYGDAFSDQGMVVSLLALAMVADALEVAATNGLLAMNQPRTIFLGNLLGAVIMLAISGALVPWWGIVGAAWGSLVGRSVTSAVQWVAFSRFAQDGKTAEVQP